MRTVSTVIILSSFSIVRSVHQALPSLDAVATLPVSPPLLLVQESTRWIKRSPLPGCCWSSLDELENSQATTPPPESELAIIDSRSGVASPAAPYSSARQTPSQGGRENARTSRQEESDDLARAQHLAAARDTFASQMLDPDHFFQELRKQGEAAGPSRSQVIAASRPFGHYLDGSQTPLGEYAARRQAQWIRDEESNSAREAAVHIRNRQKELEEEG